MVQLDRVQLNVFEVVSRPSTDDRITMQHPNDWTQEKLSGVERQVKRANKELEDLP